MLVVIPTYNERDNLGPVLARLHAAVPDADVLVVDDASPDGTGELADEMAAADPRIRVLHRTGKDGLGAAYLAGFARALRGRLPGRRRDGRRRLARAGGPAGAARRALADADLVLGSRYVPGGRVLNWPAHREWLSRGGNLYSRLALGVPIRDITGGYRAFRRQVLEELDLGEVASQGYCFQVDMAWRAVQAGFRVREVPITFTERERGASKMSRRDRRRGAVAGHRWGAARLLRRSDAACPTARSAHERARDADLGALRHRSRGSWPSMVADDGYRPDIILSIARGGLFVAGALGYALDVKNLHVTNVEFYTGVNERLPMPIMLPPVPNVVDLSGQQGAGRRRRRRHRGHAQAGARLLRGPRGRRPLRGGLREAAQTVEQCEYVWRRTDRCGSTSRGRRSRRWSSTTARCSTHEAHGSWPPPRCASTRNGSAC